MSEVWLVPVAFGGPVAVVCWGIFVWGTGYLAWLRWAGRPITRQQGEALSWAAACGIVFGALAGIGLVGWRLTAGD